MRSLLLAVAALVLAAPSAHAQGGASAVVADPHERVYETIVAQANDGPMIEGVLDWMVGELAKDPNLALLAQDNPGLLEAPYHRTPGVNECQPWDAWRDSLGDYGPADAASGSGG